MKSIITKIYTMEELLPVVADLTNKFTCYESSSVTYERAQQLMEAVIYCIAHFYGNKNYCDTVQKALPGFFK